MLGHILEGGVNPSLEPDSWQGELLAFDQASNIFQIAFMYCNCGLFLMALLFVPYRMSFSQQARLKMPAWTLLVTSMYHLSAMMLPILVFFTSTSMDAQFRLRM